MLVAASESPVTRTYEYPAAHDAVVTKWLQSGRRRDMCVLLAGDGPLTGQALKTRLQRHHDERIEPRSFRGALSALEDAGFVERREAGIADEYALTDLGERRVRDHFEWMRTQVDGAG
jgi:DNA-binding PadR family transcriptional regulator